MTYDPPVVAATEFLTVKQDKTDAEGLIACTLQQEPAKQSVNLMNIPIMVAMN